MARRMRAYVVSKKGKSWYGASAKRWKKTASRQFRRMVKQKMKTGEWDIHEKPRVSTWDLI